MIANLIDRIKLPFRKDRELYSSLYRILGFYPHNIEIYRTALAHKSASYKGSNGKSLNNERLEFLGDAILEATVSDILYHHFERKREGFLTDTRSKLVQRTTLNALAKDMKLEELVKSHINNSSHNSHLGGNALEALVGAVYLDRGYKYCKWFLKRRILGRLIDIDGMAKKEVNFKSKLLEWSQKNKISALFELTDTLNPGTNNPYFETRVVLEGIVAGTGNGYSKKESQQKAAKEALMKLRREPKFLDSIFRAKEKRTAMGAEEFSVLPKIDEIEEEIARLEQRTPECRTETPVKKRSRRAAREAQRNNNAQQAESTENTGANTPGKTETEKKKPTPRKRSANPPAKQAEAPMEKPNRAVEKSEKQAQTSTAQEASAQNDGEKPTTRSRRRKRPRQDAENASEQSEKAREEIIRAAEEAAFNQE